MDPGLLERFLQSKRAISVGSVIKHLDTGALFIFIILTVCLFLIVLLLQLLLSLLFCCHQSYLLPLFFASSLQAPPPSVHSGISVIGAQEALSRQQKPGSWVEGAPPAYSEVIGHYYHPSSLGPSHQHQTVSSLQAPPSSFIHGLLRPPPQQQGSVDIRNARNTKEKSQKPQKV